MTRLLRAELARAAARPVVWGVVLVVALGAVGLVAIGWWDTRPPTGAQVAAAQVALAEDEARWRESGPELVAACRELEAEVRGVTADHPDVVAACGRLAPALEHHLPYRPGLAEILDGRVATAGLMVLVGMLVVGAGLVTADFTSGAMSTWLTFEPRRGRVLVSRVVVAAAAGLPAALVAGVVVVGGLTLVAHLNGTATDVSADVALDLAGRGGRWVVAGLGAATLGAALAFALRHGAAVTGVVVWWVAAIESALPLVLPEARWLPLATNLTAWTTGVATYDVPACVPDPAVPGGEVCEYVTHVVGAGQGALVAVVLVVAALATGWASFRLRDVA